MKYSNNATALDKLNKTTVNVLYTYSLNSIDKTMIVVDKTSLWIQCLAAILSILLNSLILYHYSKKRVVHVKKVLVVFLSIFDLLYSISQVFLIHRRFIDHQWIFGEVVCKFTMISPFSIMSSIYIILLIAIDRHRSIIYPYKKKFTKKQLYYAVLVTSTISLLVQLPSVLNIKLVEESGYKDCAKTLIPSESAYTDLFLFIFSYLVPIILLLVCYTAIISRVRRRERKRKESSCMEPINSPRIRSNKRNSRMTVVLLSLILSFIITSTPNQMMILWFGFGNLTAPNAKTTFVVFHLLSSLIHTHSFVNPIIYSICDPNFCQKLRNKTLRQFRSTKGKDDFELKEIEMQEKRKSFMVELRKHNDTQ